MKKSTILIVLTFAILTTYFPLQDSFAQTKWQCGYKTIRLGERYSSVLSKCGDPDDTYFYQSELGLRLGTKLMYHEKKLVILTFQDEFLRPVTQRSRETVPVYLIFDRWGICIRIQEGDKP